MTVITFPLLWATFCVIYAWVLPRFDKFQDINIKLDFQAEQWVALKLPAGETNQGELISFALLKFLGWKFLAYLFTDPLKESTAE